MSGFKLDTSGGVRVPDALLGEPRERSSEWRWSDLSPFAQGYIEAAFESVEWPDPAEGFGPSGTPRFSDLAHATLAAMLEDCERWKCQFPRVGAQEDGMAFWVLRNAQFVRRSNFPPLTLYLADDGKIHQREAR